MLPKLPSAPTHTPEKKEAAHVGNHLKEKIKEKRESLKFPKSISNLN